MTAACGACGRAAPPAPPFTVRAESADLVFVWFDDQGEFHTASRLDAVPPERRALVRVDSMRLSPDERRDPSRIWVADLRAPSTGGTFALRRMAREEFERRARPALRPAAAAPADAAGVILYRTSWCGVCQRAASYFRSRGIAFVEKDVERDAGAADEMRRKAEGAGVSARGVPVIDVYGRIVAGFDEAGIDRLLAPRR